MFFKKRARQLKRPLAGNSGRPENGWSPQRILALQILVVTVLLGFAIWSYARSLDFFGRQAEPEEAVLRPLDVLSSSDIARSLANLARFREVSWVEIQAYNSRTLTADVGGLPVVAKPAVINSTIRTRHDILQYVVSPNDTVFSLANYFSVSAASIRLSNGLEGNSLTAGETILIPPPGLNGIAYLVEEGDTLTTLTNAYNFSSAGMLSFNDLEADEPLPLGEFIFLPHANLVALQDVPDFVTQAVISNEQRDEESLFDIDQECFGCDIVRTGDKIGTLGNTGWSTGPHLHLEVITYDGRRHNPWSFINQNRLVWPVDQGLAPGQPSLSQRPSRLGYL